MKLAHVMAGYVLITNFILVPELNLVAFKHLKFNI